jgi:hypothetical protein
MPPNPSEVISNGIGSLMCGRPFTALEVALLRSVGQPVALRGGREFDALERPRVVCQCRNYPLWLKRGARGGVWRSVRSRSSTAHLFAHIGVGRWTVISRFVHSVRFHFVPQACRFS